MHTLKRCKDAKFLLPFLYLLFVIYEVFECSPTRVYYARNAVYLLCKTIAQGVTTWCRQGA